MNPRKYTEESLKGKKFNALTYVRESHKNGKTYYSVWKCDCGNEITCATREVVIGRKRSCKCYSFRKNRHHGNWSGAGELTGSHWNSVLNNAKTRDIKVLLTIEEAWEKFVEQDRKCALTGVELTLDNKDVRYGKTASLDRINSGLPYSKDNVQWIHKKVNYIKRDLPEKDFLELCREISKHNP